MRSNSAGAISRMVAHCAAEPKMQAMQAQVEPHFLFNTLASIDHLIETDPPRASQMQRNLIAYGLISRPRAVFNLAARSAYRVLPTGLLKRVYAVLFHRGE